MNGIRINPFNLLPICLINILIESFALISNNCHKLTTTGIPIAAYVITPIYLVEITQDKEKPVKYNQMYQFQENGSFNCSL